MVDRIKTAAELAMEKTERIKKQKGSEKHSLEVERYVQAARKVAQDLVEGKTEVAKVKESLDRYPQEAKTAARQAMLDEFAKGINLDNTTRILQGISSIKDDDSTRESLKQVGKLYQQYHRAREEKIRELEETYREQLLEELKKEGIQGSAVLRPNLKGDSRLEEIRKDLDEEYRRNLSGFLSFLTSSHQ